MSPEKCAPLVWFKSSYSGPEGGECVEVATERRAPHGWFKSSHSGNEGGACVEVAVAEYTVRVRDSKDVSRPHLTVNGASWSRFVRHAARG